MELYPHQQRVSQLVLDGRNVLLAAPTGSGKTYAALNPFLLSLDNQTPVHDHLPSKCVYSVPMRVLANQFIEEYEKNAQRFGQRIGRPDIKAAIQTGDQPTDPELTANLIFATIDQTLSSYLLSPYSLSGRVGNVNAGALIGTYLVLDEFHLYDSNSTLPTALHMLRQVNGLTPFVLMTATFTDSLLDELADVLNCVVVPGNAEERAALLKIGSQQKKRRYHVADHALNSDAVLDRHVGQTLVICNQVERAQRLYNSLLERKSNSTRLLLLHSQFLSDDRKHVEQTTRDLFKAGEDVIVVSTQAIEVGVDISSRTLHTELAPANSLVQRAGRCARREGDEGDVYIYAKSAATDEEIDLTERTMPYQGMDQVILQTLDSFQQRSGTPFTYLDEQAVLNEAHRAQDERLIRQLRTGSVDHRERIYAVQSGSPRDDARHLVRDVVSQAVTISADTERLRSSPFSYPSFSLHPGTVQKHIREWLERAEALEDDLLWSVRYLHEHDLERQDFAQTAEQRNEERYSFPDVLPDNPRVAWNSRLIVVHPLLAAYDAERGFIPHRNDEPEWQTELPADKGAGHSRPPVRYRLESYATHIRHVRNAFHDQWDAATASTARRVEATFGWERDTLRHACEIAVLLHDVGKLTIKWQKWVQAYQTRIDDDCDTTKAYAHTNFDYSNEEHQAAQRAMGARPYHALEGALAVLPILASTFTDDDLLRAVFTAIARHHAPFTHENQTTRLLPNAREFIKQTLEEAGVRLDLSEINGIAEALQPMVDADRDELFVSAQEQDKRAFFAYLIIVRALRRADQAGTAAGTL